MSGFDQDVYEEKFIHRLTNGYGLPQVTAKRFAKLAVDVLRDTHPSTSIYITARKTDNTKIKQDYAIGMSIETLARRHGLTVRRIRQIVKK